MVEGVKIVILDCIQNIFIRLDFLFVFDELIDGIVGDFDQVVFV